MNSTLQELTDKIYNEGVVKAQNEANEIISKAEAEANNIIERAKAEANRLRDNSEKDTNTLKKNVEAEVKLFAEQAVNALKTTITNLICGKIATESVQAASSDREYMQEIITKIAQSWIEKGNVSIETSDAAALNNYFSSNAKELLNKGVKIEEVKGMKTSFTISPEGCSYKITIGDDEFIEYFKEFLRPQLRELLF